MNRLLVLLFLFASTCSLAQVIEYPLNSNPVIKDYLKSQQLFDQGHFSSSKSTVQSVLTLPFRDDFSYDGIYPDPTLWTDSDVFINSSYADNPPTVGVATFDGIDKFGN